MYWYSDDHVQRIAKSRFDRDMVADPSIQAEVDQLRHDYAAANREGSLESIHYASMLDVAAKWLMEYHPASDALPRAPRPRDYSFLS